MHVLMHGREKLLSFLARNRRKATTLAVAGAVILGVGAASALTLKLVQGANSVTVDDAGNITTVGTVSQISYSFSSGIVSWNGRVGNFTTNVTTSLSKPLLGGNGVAEMDLSSVNVSNSSGGTLVISASDTGFAPPFGPPTGFMNHHATVGGTLGTPGGSVTFTSNVDNSNTLFGTTGSNIAFGPFVTAAYSGDQTKVFSGSVPFAITQTASITHTGAKSTSFDLNTQVYTPEASSLALLLPGLAPLGLVMNRRRLARKSA